MPTPEPGWAWVQGADRHLPSRALGGTEGGQGGPGLLPTPGPGGRTGPCSRQGSSDCPLLGTPSWLPCDGPGTAAGVAPAAYRPVPPPLTLSGLSGWVYGFTLQEDPIPVTEQSTPVKLKISIPGACGPASHREIRRSSGWIPEENASPDNGEVRTLCAREATGLPGPNALADRHERLRTAGLHPRGAPFSFFQWFAA